MTQKKNHFLLEFLSIVFAVTLALVLDEWRQGVKDDKLQESVLNSIRAEVKANLAEIDKALPYHETLLNNLQSGSHVIVTLPLSAINMNINNDKLLAGFLGEALMVSQQTLYERILIRRAADQRFLLLDDKVWRLETSGDSLKIYGADNIQLRSPEIANNGWQLAQATQVMIKLPFEMIELLSQLHSRQTTYEATAAQALEKIYDGNSKIQGVMEDLLSIEQDLRADYQRILIMLDEEL